METFITSGNIVIAIIAVMAVEAIALLIYARRVPAMIMGLAAGASLALALGAALQQRGWVSVACFLTLAFFFHVLELWQWLKLAKRLQR